MLKCVAIYVSIFISKLKILEFYMNIQTYKYVVGNLLFITQYVLPRSFEKNFSIGTVNGSLWTLQFEVLLYLLAMMTYTACKYYKYNKSFIYCIHIHYTDYPSYPYIICRHGSINFTNFLFLGCYFL